MASSSRAPPGPPYPQPQGRVPTNHEWDKTLGQYIHEVTKQPWVKGGRSADSSAQQKGRKRKDSRKRDRGSNERNESAALKAARAMRTAAKHHPVPLVDFNKFEKLAAQHNLSS